MSRWLLILLVVVGVAWIYSSTKDLKKVIDEVVPCEELGASIRETCVKNRVEKAQATETASKSVGG